MVQRPRSACNTPGCPNLATNKGRCAVHQRPAWEGRRGFEGYKNEYLKLRAVVLKEEPICRICGLNSSVTADHIIPVSKGGRTVRENLRGVCKPCHDNRSQRQAADGKRK